MHKLIIVFFLLSVSFSLTAQKSNRANDLPDNALLLPANSPVPVDSITKLITYEGVTDAHGLKADVLYKRAADWFMTFYTNPTEVIRENDSLKFRIVGKPRFRINSLPDKEGTTKGTGFVQYTITVAAKDGRFKYEITAFNWKQTSYYACERWMDTKSQSYDPIYSEYLKQLDQYTKELVKNLKNALLNEKPVKDKDKW